MPTDARYFPQLALVGDSTGIKVEDLVSQTSCDHEQSINPLVGKCSCTSTWVSFFLLFALEQKEMRISCRDLCYSLSNPMAEVDSYKDCLYL